MFPTRRALLTAPFLLLTPSVLAARANDASHLAIEVSGEIPGFKPGELVTWIVIQMERSDLPWSFAPAKPGAVAPHRVAWRFTTEAGQGRFKGRSFVSAQVKLYRYTQYERSMMNQAEIAGGPLDPNFGTFITQMTRDLLSRSDPKR